MTDKQRTQKEGLVKDQSEPSRSVAIGFEEDTEAAAPGIRKCKVVHIILDMSYSYNSKLIRFIASYY